MFVNRDQNSPGMSNEKTLLSLSLLARRGEERKPPAPSAANTPRAVGRISLGQGCMCCCSGASARGGQNTGRRR